MPEISDSIVIGQDIKLKDGTPEVQVVLFVILQPGIVLDATLKKKIATNVRNQASPRHVPAVILECPAIPYTASGKKVELAVKKMVHGQPVDNRSALANPDSLDFFANIEELKI
jgi:acetoacetyl-CoA synthetase